ncbi:MAG TPA: tetratricopeptide repeat protein [Anaerolineales bacterium]|jgi:predicted ATPase/DNA-binding XRE family transcriptional regulator|nr:tetratricopeptide repeat protein [Anaerolineales bacterium]
MEQQNSPVIFNEWLKRRRKALDLTQDELAERAGCSVGALRKIESGDRRPSKQLAELLAKALEIPDEDQQTFIRVARGELNLKRLAQLPLEPARSLPDVASLLQAQPGIALEANLASPSPVHRIPLQATPLIGREAEFAALERLFNDPQCRLLTLTGTGGIGKTRLAIEFGLNKQAEFPGGTCYFPLASLNSPQEIVPAIADVLGCGFSGPAEPVEQLMNYIADHIRQAALFIFDNLEHLLVQDPTQDEKFGLVELIAEILGRLPDVKILGTSRERLNLHGEWAYELHGLSVPSTAFVGRLEEYDSIALFVRSAQRIRPDFQVTVVDQLSLIQISQLVEGVPLAIELAAAWVGMLSCQEIAREIKSNMDFLTTSMRDLPERHRSLRATFDHSWKLLPQDERWALCGLSVFHGGFDRHAAQQVAGASLLLLASLSAKSLVRRTETGRYDLHEVIRQFALSHLNESPLNDETRARHSEYYLALVRDSESKLKSASQQATIRRLAGEIDNIRAAWAWAIDQHDFDRLGQAGRGFGWYFEITGLYREGTEQLGLLVQALKAGPQDEGRRRLMGLALIHQALLYFRKGEFAHACQLYEESILILRPIGDRTLLADALVFLGTILHMFGEYERARASQEEGLVYARQTNQRWFEAWAVFNLGYIDSLLGCYAEGYGQMLVGLDIWRELGDPHAIALGLNFLAPTLNKLGRFEEAKAFMQESIALCEHSKNRWGMGTAYRHLGLAYLAAGQVTPAQTHLLKSLEIFGQFSQGWDIARSLTYLGDAARMAGDFPEARKYYQDALGSSIDEHLIPIALDALLGLGELQAQTGKPENALKLCYYILGNPVSEHETKSRAEQLRAFLEPQLTSQQVTTAHSQAQGAAMDAIVEIALETRLLPPTGTRDFLPLP